ncbi:EAL domain-containing protein [Chryseomicrobium sp. FSL W7-1435]|uniref:sensor domain-containing protein n=1 Tax=Chryseomicrobium sp. FSL W7-1435 TaxID=2921704 RepID=UPI00315A73EB
MDKTKLTASMDSLFGIEDFQVMLRRMPEPLCILSSTHEQKPNRFLFVNKRAEDLLLLSEQELRTYSWSEVFGFDAQINLQEMEEQTASEPFTYKRSPLSKQLKGHALRISLRDFQTQAGETYFLLTIIDATEHFQTKEQLRVTSSEFESLFKFNPNIIYAISKEGLITNLNDAGLKRLGYSRDEMIGRDFKDLIIEADLEKTIALFSEILKGHVQNFFIQLKDKHNSPFSVEITAVPIIVDQEVTGVIGMAQDISERLEMETKLRDSEESHRAFFDYNIDPVITYDLQGCFLAFNKATEDILGVEQEALIGQSFLPFIEEELRESTWHHFQQVLNGQPYQYETTALNTEGERTHLHITLIPAFVNGELLHIHCIGKDVTVLKRHQEMMRHMAYHDNLTGLGNQRLFNDELRSLLKQHTSTELGLWIVDLDRFKFINDHLGHEAGDQLITSFSERLQRIIGSRGQVFRYGGDEFAIITPHTTELATRLLAAEVIGELSKSYEIEGFHTVLTASLGISFYPRHGADEREIIRAADHAMYHAKKHGRNTFQLYSSDIAGLAHSDLRMETLLHKALENKEFVLYYQPQYHAATNKIHGIEALIRWNNPELGVVPPDAFIPVAEETGMIVPIGEWVIEEACRQNMAWQKRGFPATPISVNMSLRQFYQSDLVEKIKSILKRTGLGPRCLMLEITETIAMQEDIASDILRELKELGVRIAMDDFGTGYSSLKYLQTFSIDHIKIDKAFTDKLDTKEGRAIIATIISLGHHLDMTVVAEGVETPDQVQELRQLGCDVFQGYYFSRPLPAADVDDQLFKKCKQNGKKTYIY